MSESPVSSPRSPEQTGGMKNGLVSQSEKTAFARTLPQFQEETREQVQGTTIPPTTSVEQASEQEPEIYKVSAGEDTEQLSDISEVEATMSKSSKSTRVATLINTISPFIKNKKVRTMLTINFVMTVINMLLIFILIAFIIWNIALNSQIRNATGTKKFPCLFTYLEWSDCSSSCRVSGQDYPKRVRKVNKTSIIQARGGGKPECPSDLADHLDSAPCNTYICPTNLSHYNFTWDCFYNDINRYSDAGCYKIRNVPLDDRLILIDTNLTEPCNCSNVVNF